MIKFDSPIIGPGESFTMLARGPITTRLVEIAEPKEWIPHLENFIIENISVKVSEPPGQLFFEARIKNIGLKSLACHLNGLQRHEVKRIEIECESVGCEEMECGGHDRICRLQRDSSWDPPLDEKC